MSENITPDKFGWKLDYERYGQHEWSFGDGDTGAGATVSFTNPTAPNARITTHTAVIDRRERDSSTEVENNPENYVSPYFVEEVTEFIVFDSPEHENEEFSDLAYGEGSYMAYAEEDDATREAYRMVGFERNNPSMAFQWDGTLESFYS